MILTFSRVYMGFSDNKYCYPITLLVIVKKYLIKLWICDNGDLISLDWESENPKAPTFSWNGFTVKEDIVIKAGTKVDMTFWGKFC